MRMRFLRLAVSAVTLLAVLQLSTARADEDPSIKCSADLATQPAFSDISGKLPLGDIRQITFAMLASDAYPTVQERKEISDWFAARDACGTIGETYRQSHYLPEINTQLLFTLTTLSVIGVDLYKSKITYGEANRRVAAARDELIAKVSGFVEQYKKELASQQTQQAALQAQQADVQSRIAERNDEMAAREEDQRRQRAQMMMNFLQANRVQLQMPQYPPPNRPVFTNCSRNGNQTSCTSQ